MLEIVSPESMLLDTDRWQDVLELARRWCEEDKIPSIGLLVGRGGKTTGAHLFGRQMLSSDSPRIRDDAIFLIASITKPVVAMGALLLVERGEISLGDRVTEYLPEFGHGGKNGIKLRHLLTHTSGLPDMLPDNRDLRANQSPLSRFVEGTCGVKTSFSPGRGVLYQSMGFAILGEVIQRVSGQTTADFLQREIFGPLGMSDTALGVPDEWYVGEQPKVARLAEIRIPPDQRDAHDWNWNSRYWRGLGAPWGGLVTTPADLARFAQVMMNDGRWEDRQIFARATIQSATRNQLAQMRDIPEADRRSRPWGFGWRLHWPAHSANFGDFLGPNTFGHWGATGTVFWADPDLDAFAIIFTTEPQEPLGRYLGRLSNAIAATFR